MLIGLTGEAGSGKDTVGDILCSLTYPLFTRIAFADPMKTYLPKILGVSEKWFTERLLKETKMGVFNKTPRYIMQTFGTEWGRQMIAPDIWEQVLRSRVLQMFADDTFANIVVTDVRFESEALMINQLGGHVLRVQRDHNPHRIDATHESEKPLDDKYVADIIMNNGTLKDLQATVEYVLMLQPVEETSG
jgi:ABC-type oligopeptide transport system ATPase subunit